MTSMAKHGNSLCLGQKYIDSFLINSVKFDLCIYVIESSVKPLRIYVYKEGLPLFCSDLADGDTVYSWSITHPRLNFISRSMNMVLIMDARAGCSHLTHSGGPHAPK
jgi:hypothetical protein